MFGIVDKEGIRVFFNMLLMSWGVVLFLSLTYPRFNYWSSAFYKMTRIPYKQMKSHKGQSQEWALSRKLRRYSGKLLCSAYIPRDKNTTEIDSILITKCGIFVFESKNYRGSIYGSQNDRLWLQKIKTSKGVREEQFYNPIWQNHAHIKYLRKLLKYSGPIYSVIVFSDESKLHISDKDASECITKIGKVDSILPRHMKRPKVLTSDEINQMYQKVYPYTQVSKAVKAKHAKFVKSVAS